MFLIKAEVLQHLTAMLLLQYLGDTVLMCSMRASAACSSSSLSSFWTALRWREWSGSFSGSASSGSSRWARVRLLHCSESTSSAPWASLCEMGLAFSANGRRGAGQPVVVVFV